MISSSLLRSILLLALFISASARSDVLLLVHGWNSHAGTWIQSGVSQALQAHGWHDAGTIASSPAGIHHSPRNTQWHENSVYRVQLPAEAPLKLQAAHLFSQVRYIQTQHPGEKLILAGHSAGGVVARLLLLGPDSPGIDALITIASPNLGTDRALQGLDIAYGKPFFCPGPGIDFLKSVVGGDSYRYLRASTGALLDLSPAMAGNLIGWMNRQRHPDIEYHSIIRLLPEANGDSVVPAFSQDLNQIPAIGGKSHRHVVQGPHFLIPSDGNLLAQILNGGE